MRNVALKIREKKHRSEFANRDTRKKNQLGVILTIQALPALWVEHYAQRGEGTMSNLSPHDHCYKPLIQILLRYPFEAFTHSLVFEEPWT